MSIFKLKVVGLLGLLGVAALLFGIYIAVSGEVPAMWGEQPLITFEGIDRLMGIYPLALGLIFCFKAKLQYEDKLNVAQ